MKTNTLVMRLADGSFAVCELSPELRVGWTRGLFGWFRVVRRLDYRGTDLAGAEREAGLS